MVFREVSVIEIREVLRSRLAGAGLRTVAAQAGVDRKTARRYVEAAVAAATAGPGSCPMKGQLREGLTAEEAAVLTYAVASPGTFRQLLSARGPGTGPRPRSRTHSSGRCCVIKATPWRTRAPQDWVLRQAFWRGTPAGRRRARHTERGGPAICQSWRLARGISSAGPSS